jgi:hypothetical protein
MSIETTRKQAQDENSSSAVLAELAKSKVNMVTAIFFILMV